MSRFSISLHSFTRHVKLHCRKRKEPTLPKLTILITMLQEHLQVLRKTGALIFNDVRALPYTLVHSNGELKKEILRRPQTIKPCSSETQLLPLISKPAIKTVA